MAITQNNKLSEMQYAIEQADQQLNNIFVIKNLPILAMEKIKLLQKELNSLDLAIYQEAAVKLTGNIATKEDVFTILKEFSGFSDWQFIDPIEMDYDYESDWSYYQSNFNLVYEGQPTEYVFERKTNYRHDINSVRVTVFPDHFFVAYNSDKVFDNSVKLLNLTEFKDYIRQIFW